jgi:hypothetical protein
VVAGTESGVVYGALVSIYSVTYGSSGSRLGSAGSGGKCIFCPKNILYKHAARTTIWWHFEVSHARQMVWSGGGSA